MGDAVIPVGCAVLAASGLGAMAFMQHAERTARLRLAAARAGIGRPKAMRS